ncbi:MAG: arginine deiminase-related protein [Flavobacteriales bacterium]|nr:arginine deiminase-related protein [Flavobacteriales bacterium]
MKTDNCYVVNEWDTLKKVIVGSATSWGPAQSAEEAVDPKSREHILSGTYPTESDVQNELDAFVKILEAHGVQVLRPKPIPNLNQIFTRDVGVTLCDKFIRSSMIPERTPEWDGISSLCSHFTQENTLTPPTGVRLEGGDIMPMSNEIWMGYSEEEDFNLYKTSRTNKAAIDWLQEQFPQAKIRAFELSKSDTDPYANALHLDCCICTLSKGHAIFHPQGMKNPEDRNWIQKKYQGKLMEVNADDMYNMHCNIFSISPTTIISEAGFTAVNAQLRDWGYTVIETPFQETGKLEGLFRCSTLPLLREK